MGLTQGSFPHLGSVTARTRTKRAKRQAMRRLGYSKVFGIGDNKTGTSSLAAALHVLGFKHKGWDPGLVEEFGRGDRAQIFRAIERFEVFEDAPWSVADFYRELDRHCPGSKFVLTVRDSAAWSRSHERHFSSRGERLIEPRWWIDDYAERRDEIIRAYEERNRAIVEYFADRPDDLLVLDVVAGDGWEKLCPFLGLDVREEPFPHRNPAPPDAKPWPTGRESPAPS